MSFLEKPSGLHSESVYVFFTVFYVSSEKQALYTRVSVFSAWL